MNIQLEGNQFQAVVLPLDPTNPMIVNRWRLYDKFNPTKEVGELTKNSSDGHVFATTVNGQDLRFTIQPFDVYIPQP